MNSYEQALSSIYKNGISGDMNNAMAWTNTLIRSIAGPIERYSIWNDFSKASEYALSSGAAYEGQIVAITTGDKKGVYVLDPSSTTGLTKLATGGSAEEILEKLNDEIERSISVDNILSGRIDTISGDLDDLESEFSTLTGTTLPLSVQTLTQNLSVTVEKLDTPESGYEASYIVKQGGVQVGDFINIPKDKVISSAYLVNVKGLADTTPTPAYYISAFEVYYNDELQKTAYRDIAETSAIFWSIDNAYSGEQGGGDGPYLRITVTNAEAVPIYIPMPQLVDTYIGVKTDTVDVKINASTREISAFVNDSSIGSSKLSDGAITGSKIALSSITEDKLADGSVSTRTIQEKAVTSEKINDLAVTTAKLDANAVTTAKLALSAVTEDILANDAVTSRTIQTNAVTTEKIASNAVTNAKLANDSVDTRNIISASVTTEKIADSAITTEKIDDSAITSGKIASNAVTSSKIKDNNVITSKLANDAVTNAKLADNAVQTENIKDGLVTLDKLSSDVTKYINDGDASSLNSAKAYTDEVSAKTDALALEYASTAESNAKNHADELCVSLSTTVDKKIGEVEGKIDTFGENLSAYARQTSAYALEESKKYSNELCSSLSTTVQSVYETKSDATQKLADAKAYTDEICASISTTVDAKIEQEVADRNTAIDNRAKILSAYSEQTSSYAYEQSKEYTDEEIEKIVNSISSISSDLSGAIKDEETRAKGEESRIDGKVDGLRTDFDTVSADHEGRIDTVEEKVAKLSSAMHFKGVNLSCELSTGSTELPKPPYKDGESAQDGDVVIVKDNKEFVWGNKQWNEFGAEGIWATKAALEAEVERATEAEGSITTQLTGEIDRAKGIESTLSSQISGLSGEFETWKTDTYATDKAALESKIDNKVKVGEGTYSTTTLSNVDTLSVVKIADEDYYRLVADGKQNNDVLYVVSSDYVNGHDQRVINVGSGISSTDAVNLGQMNIAIEQAKLSIVASSLSGVQLNGLDFTVSNNVASLSIEIIDCGGAED